MDFSIAKMTPQCPFFIFEIFLHNRDLNWNEFTTIFKTLKLLQKKEKSTS